MDIDKRISETKLVIQSFIKTWSERWEYTFTLIDNPEIAICEQYTEILKVVKTFLPDSSRSNRYKVAAGMELAAYVVKPFKCDDIGKQKEINAIFATHLAIQFLVAIELTDITHFDDENPNNHELRLLIIEHIKWLRFFNTVNKTAEELPVFINANFWQAFYVAFTISNNSSK